MTHRRIFFGLLLALVLIFPVKIYCQSLPLGMHYQAVARDENGNELALKTIDVKFTILSGSPVDEEVYQEVHYGKVTSKYGVFSLVIGQGSKTNKNGPDISGVDWGQANQYLKVEIDFGRGYINMGTMQFMAVPYAMYAYKSLEAGPQGPKGDPGDPASDNQTLSFNGNILSISGGNEIDLGTLNVPHSLTIAGNTLSIMGGNQVELPNQIQDLTLDVNNYLKITNNSSATSISLLKYLDNTDSQTLLFNPATNSLSISGGNAVDLSKFLQLLSYNPSTYKLSISGVIGELDLTGLKNDADADPANELQTLTFDKTSGNLSISSKNTVSLNNTIGFKAKKSVPLTGLTTFTTYPFINGEIEFNEGSYYESGTGIFTAPTTGIYTFFVTYKADGLGSARILSILKNGSAYEVLGPDISAGTELCKWVTIKLLQGEYVSLSIYTGTSTVSGTGSFVGYRNN